MNVEAGTTTAGSSARHWQMNDNYAELIQRPKVEPDPQLMQPCLTRKTVLVTGGGGSIGSEVCRQAIDWGCVNLIILELSEYNLYKITTELNEFLETQSAQGEAAHPQPSGSFMDQPKVCGLLGSVQNRALIKRVFTEHSVDTVYHVAAYKHVALVEANPIEGVKNNLFGTLNVVEAAINARVKNVVVVSTDKAVRPTNMMGASKRLAELGSCRLTQIQPIDNPTRVGIVRFGNVAGSSGSALPRFQQQIQRNQPVTITDPRMQRYFMTIQEAAELIIQAGTLANRGDLFHLDMGVPINIESLAKRMIEREGGMRQDPHQLFHAQPSLRNIPIRYTGAHPAEKLEEELLIDGQPEATVHPKIFRIRESQANNHEIGLLGARKK